MKSKMQISLQGLNCGHCSSVIEEKVSLLNFVKNCNLNFTNKKLSFEVDEDKRDLAFNEVKKIVDIVEPSVKVKLINDNQNHEHEHNHEEEFSKRKIAINLFAIALFLFAIFLKEEKMVKNILFIASYIIVGFDVVFSAFRNIIRGQWFDENFLMTIATIGAFGIGEFPEACAVMIFYKIGEYFQAKAVGSSRKSIKNLLNIKPEFARVLKNNIEKEISPNLVKIEDIILVKAGEKIPLDGVIVDGNAFVDESMLTGESVLKSKKLNDNVLSGSINKDGLLKIKVEKEFSESTVSKILELVENASAKKAPAEKFITKFAKYYTPIVVGIAIIVAVIMPIATQSDFQTWLYRSLIFLVISCPCALVVSIPLSFFSAIGNASSKGILIKGSSYLESLNEVKAIVFDKTGTLTKGVFEVEKIIPVEKISEDELLKIAAEVESKSNHPIAKSIQKKYSKDISNIDFTSYQEIEGMGIRANFKLQDILIGNDKLMEKFNVEYQKYNGDGTILYIAKNKHFKGSIIINDKIKKDSFEAIQKLNKININTYMLTGDNQKSANFVGESLNMTKVFGNLLPQNKVEIFEKIKNEINGKIAFVGDGINDAPVLARADVGFSMGALGSDAAIEASDVVLMTDEPSKIFTSIEIAKKTRKIVIQNIVFALGIKILVMVLGLLGDANMWEAIFADVGVSLLAVLNSARLINFKK